MNIYFLIAGGLCFILGIIHSILGEQLIFKHKRIKNNLVPSKLNGDLKERHLRIIWATWHLVSVFGWCIGTMVLNISLEKSNMNEKLIETIIQPSIYAMFTGFLLVLIGTKGKHPGWIVLLLIAILLFIGKH